jgi:hypothetical protein
MNQQINDTPDSRGIKRIKTNISIYYTYMYVQESNTFIIHLPLVSIQNIHTFYLIF